MDHSAVLSWNVQNFFMIGSVNLAIMNLIEFQSWSKYLKWDGRQGTISTVWYKTKFGSQNVGYQNW